MVRVDDAMMQVRCAQGFDVPKEAALVDMHEKVWLSNLKDSDAGQI